MQVKEKLTGNEAEQSSKMEALVKIYNGIWGKNEKVAAFFSFSLFISNCLIVLRKKMAMGCGENKQEKKKNLRVK